jgi:parallel beta-helix repeat protein
MGQNIEIVKLQIKRGPEAQLPTLDAGEPAITTDTHKIFIGDGTLNHELAHKADLDATNVSLADIMSKTGVNTENFKRLTGETDDSPRIGRALASLSSGGFLAFPQGVTYTFNTTVTITIPNIKLVGLGGLIQLGVNGVYCFDVQADNVTFDGIRFANPSGYTFASSSAKSGGIVVHANNCIIRNSHFDGMLHSIMVEANGEWKGTQILNNRLTNCLGAISGTSQDKEAMGDGICVFGSDALIVGNFVSCKANQDARIGINVEGLPTYRTDGQGGVYTNPDDGVITISGNIVEGNQGFRRAIHVERVKNFTVTGNAVKGCTWWGIVVAADYGSVIGNSIQAPLGQTTVPGSEWSPVISGIYSQLSSYVNISNNAIYGRTPINNANLARGIYLHPQSTQMNVNGNTIGGDSASLQHGIYFESNSDDIIQGNKIQGTAVTQYGIYGWDAVRCMVNGNHVKACGSDGIRLDNSSSYCEINNNHVSDNIGNGIYFTNSDSNTFIGNVSTDSRSTGKTQTTGLYAWNPTNCLITGNIIRGNATNQISLNNTQTGTINTNNIVT